MGHSDEGVTRLIQPGDAPARRPRTAHRPGRALLSQMVGVAMLALPGALAACYTTAPITSAPAPGTDLVLDLNDRGRVALGENIGPSATEIEGKLARATDTSYTLHVERVRYINGSNNQWSGESLAVRKDYVRGATVRTFSQSRTWIVAISAVAAVVAFAVTRDLGGSGNAAGDTGCSDPATCRGSGALRAPAVGVRLP